MKRGFVLRGVAAQEFDDSIAHYEGKREGLGEEFRAVIEPLFQCIADNPELFPQVRGEVHLYLTDCISGFWRNCAH